MTWSDPSGAWVTCINRRCQRLIPRGEAVAAARVPYDSRRRGHFCRECARMRGWRGA